MAITQQHPRSATVALCLAICGAALIPAIFVLAPVGALVFGVHEPVWFMVLFGVIVLSAVLLPAAAVATGHLSRRRNAHDQRARYALVIGYCILGLTGLLVTLAVVTWIAIR